MSESVLHADFVTLRVECRATVATVRLTVRSALTGRAVLRFPRAGQR